MSTWFWVRIAIIVCMAATSLAIPLHPQAVPPIGWSAVAVISAFSAIGLIFIIGIQARNSRSARVWSRPAWGKNPFNVRNPLQFFHMAGFAFIVAGVVLLARIAFSGVQLYPEALVQVAMGVGVLVAVRVSMVLYKSKLAPNNSLKADGPDGPRL